ncbi:Lactonase, 7-bladed beta-propeller-domain-containing protein [Hypoxylon sp. NC1633]|nr:Lactonase, 7-bladed beta-propeller-domain-containing protein [Hypoxylon sp. NC1633]
MRFTQSLLGVAGIAALTDAAKHRLILGSFSTNSLYTAEYDDTAGTLELVGNFSTTAAISWIALNHDKTTLYGTDWNSEIPSFVSFGVKDDALTFEYQQRLSAASDCTGKKSIFIAANPLPPYTVYGNYFYGNAKCGTVMSVDDTGSLSSVIQNFEYADGSAVHGVSFSPDSKYLFSADDGGNSVWVHNIEASIGTLAFASRLEMPWEKADPRHVVTHPKGQYVYTVLEGSSQVVQLLFSSELGKLYLMNETWPLIKDGDVASDFWADEVALSATGKYLYASNRAHDPTRKGYISAMAVDDDGFLSAQHFLTETTNSGGFANAVSPSPFDDSIVAITDNSTGFVELWKMNDDQAGAKVIALLDIKDGSGCCANAVWYS